MPLRRRPVRHAGRQFLIVFSLSPAFLRDRRFWAAFILTLSACAIVYGWMGNLLSPYLPGPARPPVTADETLFAVAISLLLAMNAGLYAWQRTHGSCPVGTRRATGMSGLLGAAVLLCPACTVLPLAFIGGSVTLAVLMPFLPLLRLVAAILAVCCLALLWPRRGKVGR